MKKEIAKLLQEKGYQDITLTHPLDYRHVLINVEDNVDTNELYEFLEMEGIDMHDVTIKKKEV